MIFLSMIWSEYKNKSKNDRQIIINPFNTNVPFLYPLKGHKTKGFLTFSGGTEMGHWREKGEFIPVVNTFFYIMT